MGALVLNLPRACELYALNLTQELSRSGMLTPFLSLSHYHVLFWWDHTHIVFSNDREKLLCFQLYPQLHPHEIFILKYMPIWFLVSTKPEGLSPPPPPPTFPPLPPPLSLPPSCLDRTPLTHILSLLWIATGLRHMAKCSIQTLMFWIWYLTWNLACISENKAELFRQLSC